MHVRICYFFGSWGWREWGLVSHYNSASLARTRSCSACWQIWPLFKMSPRSFQAGLQTDVLIRSSVRVRQTRLWFTRLCWTKGVTGWLPDHYCVLCRSLCGTRVGHGGLNYGRRCLGACQLHRNLSLAYFSTSRGQTTTHLYRFRQWAATSTPL